MHQYLYKYVALVYNVYVTIHTAIKLFLLTRVVYLGGTDTDSKLYLHNTDYRQ